MILFIDNYDSFTYNLVQFVGSVTPDALVVRNDEITVDEIRKLNPSRIILSPGPGYPKNAGVCEDVITHAVKLMHGKKSDIYVDTDCKIFADMPKVVEGARYHSLIAKRDTIPQELIVIAEDYIGEVMGVKHRDYEIYGLQFHPESILTSHGMQMIRNFIERD